MSKFRFPVAAGAALLVFSIAIAPITAVAQCVDPPSGMINWWPADNNTFDIIGGNHGTLQNGAGFGAGQVAQAFNFDGVNDYVEVPHDPNAAFNFDGSFTIDAWIFLESAPLPARFSPIVSKWDDVPEGVDHQRNYFLSVTNNVGGATRLRCDVSSTGTFGPGTVSSRAFSDTQVPLNTWTHVACVFNAAVPSITMYINGLPAGTTPFPSTIISPTVTDPFDNDRPILIGAGDLGGIQRNFFDGRIDEVELFDRALAATEVFSIFDADTSGKTIPIVIDIKPGDDGPNPINLKSKGKVPVAILSTETFDATTLDIESIVFAGAGVNVKNNGALHASFEDVNADGLLDLVLHFNTQDLVLDDTSTEAILTGTTDNGRCVSATGSVKIVPSS